MRTGATGIFPAFYAVKLAKDINPCTLRRTGLLKNRDSLSSTALMVKDVSLYFPFRLAVQKDGLVEKFQVRFLGSVQVPVHKGSDVLCAAMQKVK